MTTYHYTVAGKHGGSHTVLTGSITSWHRPSSDEVLLEAMITYLPIDNNAFLAFIPLSVSVFGGKND